MRATSALLKNVHTAVDGGGTVSFFAFALLVTEITRIRLLGCGKAVFILLRIPRTTGTSCVYWWYSAPASAEQHQAKRPRRSKTHALSGIAALACRHSSQLC